MSETVVKEFVTGVEVGEIAGVEITYTPFCTYKFQEACRLIAEIVEEFGIGEVLEEIASLSSDEDVTASQAGVTLAPLLPKVLRALPDAVRQFVAVCCIPDAKLKELYATPNAIKEEVERINVEIMFGARTPELLHVFGKFLECLEINDLKNEISQVVTTFSGLMSQAQMMTS